MTHIHTLLLALSFSSIKCVGNRCSLAEAQDLFRTSRNPQEASSMLAGLLSFPPGRGTMRQ
ncbi:hypothetical protein HYALB_00003976 [Hymenoscyphus albidus]|uniref:Uncharacterized protein n=1 Tax=Hymenoscyphus albidus TaxID=595503 RepID=A0A9N9LXJ7_9HELO|nr:hypothetical protein HYALB_00003976 [Hymenoscyphus albidus]